MILKSLRLKNFKGLLAGAGLDDVTIDFSGLAGTVALVGRNGMGKTTILDNCHPFRLMPYKLRKSTSGWSTAAFNYYDQCSGEARKELEFEMGGTLYKSVILIDSDKRKQEAYLYRWDGASGWFPLNDGKTKTYDARVDAICGSPSLFFTSVFRSQGAKNLSDYTRGDIMGIVAELLNIDRIREQGQKAKAVADAILADRDNLGFQVSQLRASLEHEEGVAQSLAGLRQDLESAKKSVSDASASISSLQEDLKNSEAAIASRSGDKKRLQEKQTELSTVESEAEACATAMVSDQHEVEAEIRAVVSGRDDATRTIDGDMAAASGDLQTATTRFQQQRASVDEQLARAEKLISGAILIREKAAEEDRLQDSISALQEDLFSCSDEESSVQQELRRLQSLEDNLKAEERVLADLRRRSEMLDSLDCRADESGWVNDVCPLLEDAIKARNSLEEVSARVVEMAGVIEQAQANDPAGKLTAVKAKAEDLRRTMADNRAALEEVRKFSKLLPELEQAETKVADLRERILELEGDLETAKLRFGEVSDRLGSRRKKLVEDSNSRVEALTGKLQRVVSDGAAKQEQFSKRMDALRSEIQSLELLLLGDHEADVERLKREIAEQESAKETADASVRDLSVKIGAAEARMEEFGKVRVQIGNLEQSMAAMDIDAADWRLLQKACSNDGIIALEIDDAGPSISSIANDLLRTCYGPRYSIRIETQAEKANGGSKEAFDITVFDSVTDESKSITEMSGGQVCWIEDALTRAICLFNINRSDRVFGTLFSDEKDGALDADRKNEFMAVKRRSLELGSHGLELFITQTPELIDLADGVIRLEPGKVEVQ